MYFFIILKVRKRHSEKNGKEKAKENEKEEFSLFLFLTFACVRGSERRS
jgi:hypothetical protein